MARCPVCGTPATSDDVFCSNCGQRLPQPSATPPQDSRGGSAAPPVPPMPGPPPVSPGGTTPRPPGGQSSPQGPVTPSYQSQPVQPSQEVRPQTPPAYTPPPTGASAPPPVAPPKKKRSGCLIAAVVIVVLLLCGAAIVGGVAFLPDLFDPEPPPTFDTTFDDTTTGTETVLDIVNESNATICYVYISPSTSDDWGPDWLGASEMIEPGFAMVFYVEVGETLDMQLEDCDGNILDSQYNITVPPEGLTYTLSP